MILPISLAWLEMTPPSWDSGRVRMAFVLGQRGGTSPSGTSGLHPWPESPPSNPEPLKKKKKKKTLAKTWWGGGCSFFHQFLILFVEMRCVTQAALELSVKPTQASSPQRSFCLSFSPAGITGMSHHSWLPTLFDVKQATKPRFPSYRTGFAWLTCC